MTRNFEAANRVVDRALAINPQSFNFWGFKAKLAFAERGDLTVAEKSLERLDQEIASGQMKELDPEMRAEVALGKGSLLLCRGQSSRGGGNTPPGPTGSFRRPSIPAWSRLSFSKPSHTKSSARRRRRSPSSCARKTWLRRRCARCLTKPHRHSHLAQVLARLGEKEAAIMEGKRATGTVAGLGGCLRRPSGG